MALATRTMSNIIRPGSFSPWCIFIPSPRGMPTQLDWQEKKVMLSGLMSTQAARRKASWDMWPPGTQHSPMSMRVYDLHFDKVLKWQTTKLVFQLCCLSNHLLKFEICVCKIYLQCLECALTPTEILKKYTFCNVTPRNWIAIIGRKKSVWNPSWLDKRRKVWRERKTKQSSSPCEHRAHGEA